MSSKTAYLVDFDGTITTRDLTSELASFYGGRNYMKIEESYRRRKIPIKIWLKSIAEHLPADLDTLLAKAMQWAVVRPGFTTFLEHARGNNAPVIIASDGFGFYIEPVLKEHGLMPLVSQIYHNFTVTDNEGKLAIRNPYAHNVCPVCGNCKAAHVMKLKKEGYSVIYIGDGSNDRFGASWSDHICARDQLARICEDYKFKYSQWTDFYDIIRVENPELSDRTSQALCLPDGEGIKTQGMEGIK